MSKWQFSALLVKNELMCVGDKWKLDRVDYKLDNMHEMMVLGEVWKLYIDFIDIIMVVWLMQKQIFRHILASDEIMKLKLNHEFLEL